MVVQVHFVDHAAKATDGAVHSDKVPVDGRDDLFFVSWPQLIGNGSQAVHIGEEHRHQAMFALQAGSMGSAGKAS